MAAQVGRLLTRYHLEQPALIILDAGKPLIFPAAQLLYIAQPALSLFWSYERLAAVGRFLEDPEAMQQLRAHLEAEA